MKNTMTSTFYEAMFSDSDSVETLVSLGTLCFREREFEKSVSFFDAAIERFRQRNLGTPAETLEGLGRLNLCLGTACRAAGRLDEALESLVVATEFIPDVGEVYLSLGQVYHELKQPFRALSAFATLTRLRADDASAWLTLGLLQLDCASPDEAITSLQRARDIDPQSPDVHYLLGEALRRHDKYAAAVESYQRLLPIAFEYPQGLVGLAKSLLALGRLEEGWDAFEFRRICQAGMWEMRLLPQWDGEANRDTTLLVHSEDGIGSDILFASCLSATAERVKRCVVECDSSLQPLLARSFPNVSFIPISADIISEETQLTSPVTDPASGKLVTAQVSFGTMPRFTRRRLADFPVKRSYLIPDAMQEGVWRERLAILGAGTKIGVVWHGVLTPETEVQRTLPLATLSQEVLLRNPHVSWISLQGGSAAKHISLLQTRGVDVKQYHDAVSGDLDSLAALLTSLDLVITPPGYMAHLAGAVGAETWLVLPADHDWRWDVAREVGETQSLWHRSMTLFRQGRGEAWESVFQRVHQNLTRRQTSSIGIAVTRDETAPTIFSLENFREKNMVAPTPSRRAA